MDFLYPYSGSCIRTVGGSGRLSCRSAAWVPDLQHHRLPEYFSPAELVTLTKPFRQIAVGCSNVVFSSESSLGDFRRLYPDATAAASVVPFRVSIEDAALAADPGETVEKDHLPRKFLLVSNQFWQHKNHLLLLDAIAQAAADAPDLDGAAA